MAQGKLREFIAHAVGGEVVLARMIEEGKAVAYMCNGHQYVRTCDHRWEGTTALTNVTQMQGKSAGEGALGDNTIESLCDLFSNTLENVHIEHNQVLDIGDARSMRAHVDGMALQRHNRQQLMLGDSSCPPGAWGIQLRLFGISPTRPSHYLI